MSEIYNREKQAFELAGRIRDGYASKAKPITEREAEQIMRQCNKVLAGATGETDHLEPILRDGLRDAGLDPDALGINWPLDR